jgi:hypothetical protein
VYGGTFPNGKVFRYDHATGAVRDYGQVKAGQPYVKSIDYANGKIYTGSLPDAHIMELDVASGAITELPSPPGLGDPTDKVVYDLNARAGRVYARISTAFPGPMYVWDIASRTWVDEIPNAHGLDISPVGDNGEIYLIQASELKKYDPATKTLTGTGLTFTGRIQNTRSIGWAELGLPDYPGKSIVGTLWRGEEFRYNPQTGKSEIFQTAVRREPIEILSVAGGKDKIYAGGFLNGGVSVVDPATGNATFNRFSQVEALLEGKDGKLWIGAYPEARLYSYDLTQPWSSPEYSPGPPGTPDNPKQLLNLKPDIFQTRARALVEVNGKIAIGTVPDGARRRARHLRPGDGYGAEVPQRGPGRERLRPDRPRRHRVRRYVDRRRTRHHATDPDRRDRLRVGRQARPQAVGDRARARRHHGVLGRDGPGRPALGCRRQDRLRGGPAVRQGGQVLRPGDVGVQRGHRRDRGRRVREHRPEQDLPDRTG